MSTLVTKEAPDFSAQAVMGDNTFEELKLSSYRGKYVVLFFYPLDFTFVCPSEIIAFDTELEKFKERNAEVIGVSVDSHFTHLAWKNTPRDQGGIGEINYPLVAALRAIRVALGRSTTRWSLTWTSPSLANTAYSVEIQWRFVDFT
jgi:peroxiredoxin (alkyl hydroperoxide reductase subunit C)